MRKYALIVLLFCSGALADQAFLDASVQRKDGQICVEQYAADGCNSCELTWTNGKFSLSCTELGCHCTDDCERIHQCKRWEPETIISIPPLKGKEIPNCSEALHGHELCRLHFLPRGFTWDCTKISADYPTEQAICTRDLQDNPINHAALQEWKTRQESFQHEQHIKQEAQTYICLDYLRDCTRCHHHYFPPQTHHIQKAPSCRTQPNCDRPNQCLLGLTKGELPAIDFKDHADLLDRQPINRVSNCVRYENACMAYALELGYAKPVGEKWSFNWYWAIEPKNCAKATYHEKIKETMQCTSTLSETDLIAK